MRIGTRCIGEEGLEEVGAAVDEAAVARYVGWIEANPVYLGHVGDRPHPRHPAKVVSRYSWAGCVVFTEAMSRVTGLSATTMLPEQVRAGHEITKEQLHAVVLHPDGSVEDV